MTRGKQAVVDSLTELRLLPAGHPSPERALRRWVEYVAETYQTELISDGSPHLTGPTRGGAIGDVQYYTTGMNAHRCTRRRNGLGSGEQEMLTLVQVNRGKYRYAFGGRETVAEPGDLLVFNGADRSIGEVCSDTQIVNIQVPMHAMRARLPWIDREVEKGTLLKPSLLHSVTALFNDLMTLPLDHRAAQTSEAVCVDLIALMLDVDRSSIASEGPAYGMNAMILRQVDAFIDVHLGDPGLGAKAAALACGMSERKLQKLYQDQDTTFGSELRRKRMTRADQLLADPAAYRLSIGEIGFRCGFVSHAHFAYCYRTQFGITPSDRRRSSS